jgi:hypothetical protein
MSFSRSLIAFLLGVFIAAAQDSKPNLSGNWRLKAPCKTASAMTVVIEQQGKAIHVVKSITGSNGKESKSEFRCTTDGKDCEAAGIKVSLWFDGNALVEMDAGEAVSKSVMKLDGNSLTIEVTHIVPDGEAETFELVKI